MEYAETYSQVVQISSMQVLISLAAIFHRPLYQLDMKKCLSATPWVCYLGGIWQSLLKKKKKPFMA